METNNVNNDFPMLEEYRQFLTRESHMKARGGKSCNISSKHHERISQITNLVKDANLTISSYVDIVLDEHFEKYGSSVDFILIEKFKESLKANREA